jgi:hypothetical protein
VILFLTTTRNRDTLRFFLGGRGAAIAHRIRVISYGEALEIDPPQLPRGTWIFTDFDVFPPRGSHGIARLWRRIAERGDRILNHPTRSMRRFELLRTLAHLGINDHDVQPAADPRRPRRFPVYVRASDTHSGALSPLLPDEAALQRFLNVTLDIGWPRESLIVVEYCDARDANGAHRTFSAMRVGDRIIPDHLWFSDAWAIKEDDAWKLARPAAEIDALRERELSYLRENPHATELRRIFDIARIEYGRIDYGMRGDRIEVWEINSNPLLSDAWNAVDERRRPEVRQMFGDRLIEALAATDTD